MRDELKSELISILMPTYNVEEYVVEAVQSVLSQTYKNLELIIVDDCSTDKTYDLLLELAKSDNRIKLYRNDINSKICKTLNKAFSYAKGSFIGRMDGDDVSLPQRFEYLKVFLDNHPDVVLVGNNIITIDEEGREISRKQYLQESRFIQIGNRFQPCVAHIWLARREIYEALNGYHEVPFVEDWDFLLRGQNKGFQYANINEFLYKCRIRNGNTASTNGLIQRKAGDFILKRNKLNKINETGYYDEKEYKKAIRCTESEKNEYREAANCLNIAIHNKNNILIMSKNLVAATFKSKYIAKYLFDSTMLRLILRVEIMNTSALHKIVRK